MTAARKDSFDRITAGFYRNADPVAAAEALAYALEVGAFQKDEALLLPMFARMAELDPGVNARFRQLLTTSLDAEQRRIVQLVVDPPDQLKDARYLLTPIGDPP